MCETWQNAAAAAAHCGFSYVAALPADSTVDMEGALSILVLATPFSWFSSPWPPGYAEVSAFYFHSQRSYLVTRRLERALRRLGARAEGTQRLPAKPLAQRAGLGRIGRNGLLANDAWGSCIVLHTLATDIPPPEASAAPMAASGCEGCDLCVRACPTRALDGTGRVDVPRCLRFWMLRGESIPPALRPLMQNRLLGCEICQRACPKNAHIPCTPPPLNTAYSLEAMLMARRADREAVAADIGGNEARKLRLQAQAAILAGNAGNPRYLPALERLAAGEHIPLRDHALWAIQTIEEGEKNTCYT